MSTLTSAHTLEQRLGVEAYPDVIPESSTRPQRTPLPDIWPGTSSHVVVVQTIRELSTKTLIETAEAGGAVSTTWRDYDWMESDHQTSTRTKNTLVILLEEIARAGDHRTFAALAEAIDWSAYLPEELLSIIDLALSLELATLAIELAQRGSRLLPDHERIQHAAQVLAPPVVRTVHAPRARGMDASMAWFREHVNQYRGQWVAVREGKLLGTARSLQELEAVIGQDEDSTSTIVTKVL